MNTGTVAATVADIEQREHTPEFRIEIVYENPAAGVPALTVCERLIDQFHNTFVLRVETHSFKAIEDELQASECASPTADMIFVASAGTVPTAFVQWLKRRIEHSRSQAPMALVDMTRHEIPNAHRIHEFLKRAAEAHQLDHFSKEHFERPTTFTSSSPRTVPAHRARHWGINE